MRVLAQANQGAVGSYILALDALSPRAAVAKQPQTLQQTPPIPVSDSTWNGIVAFGPYFLFFALFFSALGIQLIRKIRDWRATFTSLLIALLLAGTPMVINKLNQQGTQQVTQAGPDEIPRAVKVEQTDSSTIVVSWTTDAQKIGSVRFGPVPLSLTTSQVYVANSGIAGTHHTTVINNVKPNRVYELEILSGTGWYNFSGKPLRIPIQQF